MSSEWQKIFSFRTTPSASRLIDWGLNWKSTLTLQGRDSVRLHGSPSVAVCSSRSPSVSAVVSPSDAALGVATQTAVTIAMTDTGLAIKLFQSYKMKNIEVETYGFQLFQVLFASP
jgi:hypothetical protein